MLVKDGAFVVTHTLGFLTDAFHKSLAAKLVRRIFRSNDGPISFKPTLGICGESVSYSSGGRSQPRLSPTIITAQTCRGYVTSVTMIPVSDRCDNLKGVKKITFRILDIRCTASESERPIPWNRSLHKGSMGPRRRINYIISQ